MPLLYGKTDAGLLVPVQVDDDGILQTNDAGTGGGDANIHGYYSGAWAKAPIPFGVSSVYRKRFKNDDLPAGAYYMDTDDVPANTIHIYTAIAFRYVGTAPNELLIWGRGGPNDAIMGGKQSPVSGVYYFIQVPIVLGAGEHISLHIISATLGDQGNIELNGYSIDLSP